MDIQEKLKSLGFDPMMISGNLRMVPIYRPSDNGTSLCVDPYTGVWYDFVMGRGGHFQSLLRMVGDNSKFDNFGTPPKDTEVTMQSEWPLSFIEDIQQDYFYWYKRGISPATLRQFDGGIWDGKFYGRYVFPIFNEEKTSVIGYAGRDVLERKGPPKWKLIGEKQDFVFPIWLNKEELIKYRFVVLVESVGDLLSLWEAGLHNVICLFGVSLMSGVLKELIGLDPKKIIIALNNDKEKGFVGNKNAQKIQETLSGFFDQRDIIISLPSRNDFSDQSLEENLLWMEKTLPQVSR